MKLPITEPHKIIFKMTKEVAGLRHTYVAVEFAAIEFATYRVLHLGSDIYDLVDGLNFDTPSEAIADVEKRAMQKPHAHLKELAAQFKRPELDPEYVDAYSIEATEELPTL
jgi:hypothetical protein